jgi:hypothetical protein
MMPALAKEPVHATKDGGVIIGRIAAGTTLTQAMIDMMFADYRDGKPPATYMDDNRAQVTIVAPDAKVSLRVGIQTA